MGNGAKSTQHYLQTGRIARVVQQLVGPGIADQVQRAACGQPMVAITPTTAVLNGALYAGADDFQKAHGVNSPPAARNASRLMALNLTRSPTLSSDRLFWSNKGRSEERRVGKECRARWWA